MSVLIFIPNNYHYPLQYRYSGERAAQLTCSINLELPKEAIVVGTKGTLKLPAPFWCPTKLETPSVSVANTAYYLNLVYLLAKWKESSLPHKLAGSLILRLHLSLVPRLLPVFQCATLKIWEEPGNEAKLRKWQNIFLSHLTLLHFPGVPLNKKLIWCGLTYEIIQANFRASLEPLWAANIARNIDAYIQWIHSVGCLSCCPTKWSCLNTCSLLAYAMPYPHAACTVFSPRIIQGMTGGRGLWSHQSFWPPSFPTSKKKLCWRLVGPTWFKYAGENTDV